MSEVVPYIPGANSQPDNAGIFDTTEFSEKLTTILAVAMKQSSPDSGSINNSIDDIKAMSDQALYGSIVLYHSNDPKIISEHDYVKALIRQALIRKSMFLQSQQD